ncbi:MAG: ATP--guanido phosphotransferase [Ruminococcaceae bacterium]|nr:ATP--guanido phosphotransferase [Oscillospiraceae bacterium]
MNDIDKFCISSRVRIARNVKGLPFSSDMNSSERETLINKVKGALGNKYTYINFSDLPTTKKLSYVERHIVSPDFLNAENQTALFMNYDKSVSVMVGEEDHIRIQAFADGYALKEAKEKAFETEMLIEQSVEFMFDDKYGYITKCPSNIGTGVRASVMMFLPTTVNTNTVASYSSELARLGMTIRGAFGESSNSVGDTYQISNNRTLGMSEDEIIDNVNNIVKALAKREEENEKKLLDRSGDKLKDASMRALGILRSAYMISNDEAQELISRVRLGSNLGIIVVDRSSLNTAMTDSFPNTLSIVLEKDLSSPSVRDVCRAEYLKKIFGD